MPMSEFHDPHNEQAFPFKQPTQDTAPLPARASRRRMRRGRLFAAGGLAAALIAGGAGGAALLTHAQAAHAASAAPATALSDTLALAKGPGAAGPHGARGPRGALKVQSVSGSTISATRPNGTTVTIKTTSSTIYQRAGQNVSANAISSGEQIAVQGTTNSDGSITATRIEIQLPGYRGLVTAVNGNTLTVRDAAGAHTVKVSSSTTYQRAGQPASLSDVHVGEHVDAQGTMQSDGSLSAQYVRIVLPQEGGQIVSINGDQIIVSGRGGVDLIQVSASTSYLNDTGTSQSTTSLSALKAGEHIQAEGTYSSDGTLNAIRVIEVPTPPARPAPPASGQAPAALRRQVPPAPSAQGAAPASPSNGTTGTPNLGS